MSKLSFLIVFLVLISCSSKNQKEQKIVKKNQNLSTQNSKDIYLLEPEGNFILNPESLDKDFEDLIKNNSTKKIKVQEYGGGDCYGGFSIFYNQTLMQKAILDKYDCGDYGFANKQFLLIDDKIIRARTYKFEFHGSEDGKTFDFEVAENVYYFNGNKVLVKSRGKITKDFNDTLLTNLKFKETIMDADSIKKAKSEELKETLASTLSED